MKEYELTQASCGSDRLSFSMANKILHAGFNLIVGKRYEYTGDDTTVEYENCYITFNDIGELQKFIDLVSSVIIYRNIDCIVIYDDYVE